MSDRELLELAAKAAGIVGKYGYAPDDYYYNGNVEGICTELPDGRFYVWNPLSDDGDALRLAIRLGMKLSTNLHHRFVVVNDEQEFYDEAKFGGVCDPEWVMRLTIVRVAAEIGRQMQEGGTA